MKDLHALSPLERDQYWMRHALALANKAAAEGEVPVGAVLVSNNQLIAQGYNTPIQACDPTAHAEINALRMAANKQQNYRLLGNTLYVTLEPCLMCLGALIHARIQRLVFGALDAKTGAIASQFSLLDTKAHNHQIDWEGGCLAEESEVLLKEFFQRRRARL